MKPCLSLLLALPALLHLPMSSESATSDPATAVSSQVLTGIVAPDYTIEWPLHLSWGVTHEIRVQGDGNSTLDLGLYDELGNLVEIQFDHGGGCTLHCTPSGYMPIKLKILNLGSSWNRFRITLD